MVDIQKLLVDARQAPQAALRARAMVAIPSRETFFKEDKVIPVWFTWTGTNSQESALADMTEVNAGEHSYRVLEAQFLQAPFKALEEASTVSWKKNSPSFYRPQFRRRFSLKVSFLKNMTI